MKLIPSFISLFIDLFLPKITNHPGFEERDTTSYTCSLYQYTNPKILGENWKIIQPRSHMCNRLLRAGKLLVVFSSPN